MTVDKFTLIINLIIIIILFVLIFFHISYHLTLKQTLPLHLLSVRRTYVHTLFSTDNDP